MTNEDENCSRALRLMLEALTLLDQAGEGLAAVRLLQAIEALRGKGADPSTDPREGSGE